MKVELKGIPETMMITLWARAFETLKEKPAIRDEYAVEMMNTLEYDFSKYKNARMSQNGVIVRTLLFDDIVKDFINRNPDASIVNLGAGVDARFFRVDNGKIRWYDLDLPEVIEIRKHYFKESGRYKMIAKSALDFSWISEIDNSDKTVLFIAEGLFMFFSEDDVKKLLLKLQADFTQGEILAEVLSTFISRNGRKHQTVKKTGADFRWGLDNSKDFEALAPGMVFEKEWNYFEYGKKHWRLLWVLTRIIPPLRKTFSMRLIRCKFNKKTTKVT